MSLTLIKKAELPTAQGVKRLNDIRTVVSRYTELKQEGRYLKGLCPFNEEKTASFHVFEDSQRYYCYSCGLGGDAIQFIREMHELSFRDALNFLSEDRFEPPSRIIIPQVRQPIVPLAPEIEATHLALFEKQKHTEHYAAGPQSLGVSLESFHALQAAWLSDKRFWTFPMRNSEGKLLGIMWRDVLGNKKQLTGGHGALYIPRLKIGSTLYVAEGATDTCALLTLGLSAVGRFNATHKLSMEYCIQLVNRFNVERVVICADNNDAGIDGAKTLAAMLPVPNSVIYLPEEFKDVREFVNKGGTCEQLEKLIP